MSLTTQKKLKRWPRLIVKKFMKAQESKEFAISMVNEDDYSQFYILLQPTGGFYRGQTHILLFKSRYRNDQSIFPFDPPLVKFQTRIYHPNVSSAGSICVDILTHANKWSPQYDINAVMTSIILLLDCPNNASPYNSTAAKLHGSCLKKYKSERKTAPDVQTELEIYDMCFKPYTDATKKHAVSPIDAFIPYFPELNIENTIEAMTIEEEMDCKIMEE